MSNSRVAVFIDGLNIRNRLRESGWPEFVDIQYLANRLTGNRKLVGCYLAVGSPNKRQLGQTRYWKELQYYQRIEKQPSVTVDYGYMVKRGSKWTEKKIDVFIATRMVAMACSNQIDAVILVTADGDLVPAVETVVSLGKKVETIVFTRSNAYVGNLIRVSTSQRNARPSHFIPL